MDSVECRSANGSLGPPSECEEIIRNLQFKVPFGFAPLDCFYEMRIEIGGTLLRTFLAPNLKCR